MDHAHYITTRTDLRLGGSPSVIVDSVHSSRPDSPGRNILPVWPMRGRSVPRRGERVGTFRDGTTLYAVGNEPGARQLTRDAYLATTCHAWTGQGATRVEFWLEPDGTIWADDSSRGRNWGEPEWTTCHDIDEQTQQQIRDAAEAAAVRRGQNGGELGYVSLVTVAA